MLIQYHGWSAGHRLGQSLIHRVAQGLQRGLCGLGKAAQLLPHAVQRAVILGHGNLGGLRGLLQRLQACQPLGRQIHAGTAQQQHHQKNQRQCQRCQENKGVSGQGLLWF